MALFETITPAQKEALILKNQVVSAMNSFVRQYKAGFDLLWKNQKATPQEILDAIGADGVELFTKSAATRDYILSVNPDLLPVQYQSPPLPVEPEIVDGAPTGRMIVG